jgi:cytochrome b561
MKNVTNSYGLVAILLHWLMAVLIITMLSLGLYMTSLILSPQKLTLYGWHKALGVCVLLLAVLRVIWRLVHVMPVFPSSMPRWEKRAARATHLALYGFMFMLPLTGWLMSSASGFPVSFFGWFTLPTLIHPNKYLQSFFKMTHAYLAYALIALLCLHVMAALKHHFIDKDDILKRILKP